MIFHSLNSYFYMLGVDTHCVCIYYLFLLFFFVISIFLSITFFKVIGALPKPVTVKFSRNIDQNGKVESGKVTSSSSSSSTVTLSEEEKVSIIFFVLSSFFFFSSPLLFFSFFFSSVLYWIVLWCTLLFCIVYYTILFFFFLFSYPFFLCLNENFTSDNMKWTFVLIYFTNDFFSNFSTAITIIF